MKKTNGALLAIIGFGIFILVLIIIGVGTAAKVSQNINPQVQQATQTANQIVAKGGNINNVVANVVNNATDTTPPSGAGSVAGSQVANIPASANVIDLGNGDASSTVTVIVGPNGSTVVKGSPQGSNIAVNVGSSPLNKRGGKIILVNTNRVGSGALIFVPGVGVSVTGELVVRPGFYNTYTLSDLNSFVGGIPVIL